MSDDHEYWNGLAIIVGAAAALCAALLLCAPLHGQQQAADGGARHHGSILRSGVQTGTNRSSSGR